MKKKGLAASMQAYMLMGCPSFSMLGMDATVASCRVLSLRWYAVQALGDRCKHCNKKLAHNASGAVGNRTRHWEGGEGCRNKKLLDRRDAAKYRNSKFKTASKKSSRVGQEGARRRKKAAAT